MQGAFITIEGIDGAGKGTQIEYITSLLEKRGIPFILLREPGGTAIGEDIRRILLSPIHRDMDDICELLLFAAARAQIVQERILPSLREGTWVVCDRFFDSTLAYQAGGRGIDRQKVLDCIDIATDGLKPDLTLYLDIDPTLAFERRSAREEQMNEEADRIEQENLEFSKRVREEYLHLAQTESRFRCIDASGNKREISDKISSIFSQFIENR